jgi:hypothetical protein
MELNCPERGSEWDSYPGFRLSSSDVVLSISSGSLHVSEVDILTYLFFPVPVFPEDQHMLLYCFGPAGSVGRYSPSLILRRLKLVFKTIGRETHWFQSRDIDFRIIFLH